MIVFRAIVLGSGTYSCVFMGEWGVLLRVRRRCDALSGKRGERSVGEGCFQSVSLVEVVTNAQLLIDS